MSDPIPGKAPQESSLPRFSRREALILLGGTLAFGLLGCKQTLSLSEPPATPEKPIAEAIHNEKTSVPEGERTVEKKEPTTMAEWAKRKGVKVFGLAAWGSFVQRPLYKELLKQSATDAKMTAEVRNYRIFKDYDPKTKKGIDWAEVLQNWDEVKKDIDAHKIPERFKDKLDPEGWRDKAVTLKKECEAMGLEFHGYGPIIGGGDTLPDGLLKGNFSPAETMKILEFIVKTKALLFQDVTKKWQLNECIGNSALLWSGEPNSTFWYQKVAGEGKKVTLDTVEQVVGSVANWLMEAVPEATVALYEEGLMTPSSNSVYKRVLDNFVLLLERIKAKKVPIKEIGNENTFWALGPPDKDEMVTILRKFLDMGFGIAPPETVVAVSSKFPLWKDRPPTVSNPNEILAHPDAAQAKVYTDTLEAYVKVGAPFGIYGPYPETAGTFPEVMEPTANSHPYKADGTPNTALAAMTEYIKSLPDKSATS